MTVLLFSFTAVKTLDCVLHEVSRVTDLFCHVTENFDLSTTQTVCHAPCHRYVYLK